MCPPPFILIWLLWHNHHQKPCSTDVCWALSDRPTTSDAKEDSANCRRSLSYWAHFPHLMPVPTAANSSFTGGVGCWPWCVVWLKDKCQLCHDCSTRKHFHFGLCEFNALPQRDGGLERRADRQADTNRMGLRIHPSILTSIHSAQAGPMCWAAHYAKQIALSCCNTVLSLQETVE